MKTTMILVSLAIALLTSGATAITACGQPLARTPHQRVLCCCQVANGGQCCGYVAVCSGAYVPGCLCSPTARR